ESLYLHALRNRFLRTPNVHVCELDPERPRDYEKWAGTFDSALCVNVLESVADPEQVVSSLAGCLKPGGAMVVLVPHAKSLYGSLDRAMGNKRRFSKQELRELLLRSGCHVESLQQLNKIGALSWWIFGKLLGRKRIHKPTLKLFDKTVWIWRRID